MGADLIGCFAFVPRRRYQTVLARHLDAVEEALAETGDVSLQLDRLAKAGVEVREWEDLDVEHRQVIEEIKADVELARRFEIEGGFRYRDGVEAQIDVAGEPVSILFAGELSWGDEPDGAGYAVLRALYRTGAEAALFKAIRWGRARKR